MIKYICFSLMVLFFSCDRTPRVYFDGYTPPLDALDAWGEDYSVTLNKDNADVVFSTRDSIIYDGEEVKGLYDRRIGHDTIIIHSYLTSIQETNTVAHEWGHFLGKHHNKDINSIMSPNRHLRKPLSFYAEF